MTYSCIYCISYSQHYEYIKLVVINTLYVTYDVHAGGPELADAIVQVLNQADSVDGLYKSLKTGN